jgi:hypothetical protein
MATSHSSLASPVAVRCARLRTAPGVDASRLFIVATCLAPTLWLIAFVSMAVSTTTAAPGGTVAAQLRALVKVFTTRFGTFEALIVVGTLVLIVWVAPAVARMALDHRMRSWTQAARAREGKTRRRSKPIFIAFLTMVLLSPCVIMLFGGGPVPGAVLGSYIYLKASLLLGVSAFFNRHGRHLVCAKCGYAMGSWRSAQATCPECANRWKENWKARIGRRTLNRGLAAFSLALFTLCGIMLVVALKALKV